jgi:stress response protein YsnF
MSKKVSKGVYDQVINEMFTYRQRQIMSKNVKRGLRLRKERLNKLKTLTGTSASNHNISGF